MATVGPAARKLHQSIARQTMTAMVFLYHCGLRILDLEGAIFLVVLEVSPVQWIVGVIGRRGHQNDLAGLMMAQADVSKGPMSRVFDL